MEEARRNSGNFRAHLQRTSRDRQVWKKFILSLGFADPVTGSTSAASTPMRQTPTRGLLTPSCLHHHMEMRLRLLHERVHRLLDPASVSLPLDSLSLSLSPLLCHCFTPSFTPSTLAPLFSFCVRQSARFRAAKEYLKRCSRASFESPSPPPPNAHPHLGDIIHCTASTVYLSEPAFQFASLILFAPCNHNTRKVARICTALYGS